MMKRSIIFLVLLALSAGCKKENSSVETALKEGLATGEWTDASTAGGFENNDSFKNFQYTFNVTEPNKTLAIELASPDIDVRFSVFDPLGSFVKASQNGRRADETLQTKTPGIYRVVVTAQRRAIGKFSLKITDTKDGLTPIPSQTLRSGTQNWGALGGGGADKTFKNHFYTFEVTDDNSNVDLELLSADTDITLVLYDNLGSQVAFQSSGRYSYILKAARKGLYTAMAGTAKRSSVGNYNLNVFGKVQNLKRIASQSETATNAWKAGKIGDITHTYSLDINSENNSPLDIELSSPDVNVIFDLESGAGTVIGSRSTVQKTHFYVSKDLPKGNYRIIIRPYGGASINTPGGNYTLQVTGQFANLKKL